MAVEGRSERECRALPHFGGGGSQVVQTQEVERAELVVGPEQPPARSRRGVRS